ARDLLSACQDNLPRAPLSSSCRDDPKDPAVRYRLAGPGKLALQAQQPSEGLLQHAIVEHQVAGVGHGTALLLRTSAQTASVASASVRYERGEYSTEAPRAMDQA